MFLFYKCKTAKCLNGVPGLHVLSDVDLEASLSATGSSYTKPPMEATLVPILSKEKPVWARLVMNMSQRKSGQVKIQLLLMFNK